MLTGLRRTRSGNFDVKDAISINTIKEFSREDLAQYLANGLAKLAEVNRI